MNSAETSESPHFPTHTVETAPLAARPFLEGTARAFGFLPKASARHATAPALLKAFAQIHAVFEHGSLAPLERETVALLLARELDCALCRELHSTLAERVGASPELVRALLAGEPLPDAALMALASFTERVIASRGAVTDAELDAFVRAGYSPEKALEVVVGVATYTLSIFANRMTRTHSLR